MQGFRGWHERGYLPHRDERGLTQFITFHVADSYPAALRSKWAALLEIEDHRERQIQLEAYLDQGRGECPLRQADIARVADTAFRFYHGKRYDLRAWVVMPNHIHALFQVEAVPLGKICVSSRNTPRAKRTNACGDAGNSGRRIAGIPTCAMAGRN